MPIYQGQNYKINRKVKEAVDKNQVNYRESADSPISIIKRVYVYITDKKGNILPEVTVTIDGETITTGYGGLLISNFPNEEKTITVSKEGYKTATATIILNAEKQTHKFFLVLETDDDESSVISYDNTEGNPNDKFVKCGTLFEPPLDGTDEITSWSLNNRVNKTENGEYIGTGSFLTQGWSNQGLWELECDFKYDNKLYVGLMPICSEEINPYTDAKRNEYGLTTWEGNTGLAGLDCILIEGAQSSMGVNLSEYNHMIMRKIEDTKIEFYLGENKWIYSVPKLPTLETLHIGVRDNPADRHSGGKIIYKNIKVSCIRKANNSSEQTTDNTSEKTYTITIKNNQIAAPSGILVHISSDNLDETITKTTNDDGQIEVTLPIGSFDVEIEQESTNLHISDLTLEITSETETSFDYNVDINPTFPNLISKTINIIWQDNNNGNLRRPSGVSVRLIAEDNNESVVTPTLNTSNNWTSTVQFLPDTTTYVWEIDDDSFCPSIYDKQATEDASNITTVTYTEK